MAIARKNNADVDQRPKIVIQRYRERLAVLRQAQEYSQKDDIPRAVIAYTKYLDYLAQYFETKEENLSPDYFTKDNNITEILLISQVYWDLSKAYDRNPKLKKECERCLSQFVKFSSGFKFQFINSEMLRKFIKKKAAYNPKSFEFAYDKIRVNSKGCFIASYAFHESHSVVTDLRLFKSFLLKFHIGDRLVEHYYRTSPLLVSYFEDHPVTGSLIKSLFIRPVLIMFSKIIRRTII